MTGFLLFLKSPLGRLLCVAALSLAIGFSAGWKTNGWRYGAAETKEVKQQAAAREEQHEAAIVEHNEQTSADEVLTEKSDAAETENVAVRDQLETAVHDQTFTEDYIDENHRPRTRRNSAYRVCYNASASGERDAITACEASRRHVEMQSGGVPTPDVVR